MSNNKIQYGLSQLHYCTAEYDREAKKYTYGEVKPIPGAKTLNLPPSGGSTVIYADNIKYYAIETNQGYNGSVVVVLIPESFIEDVLKERKYGGVRYENADGVSSEFALMGQFEGDAYPKRFCLPRCKATRKDLNGETAQESISEQNDTISIDVMPRENDKDVKYSIERADDPIKYAKWFEGVHERAMVDYISFKNADVKFISFGEEGFKTEYTDCVCDGLGDSLEIVGMNGNIKTTVTLNGTEVQPDEKGVYALTYTADGNEITVTAENLLGDSTVYTFNITATESNT